MVGGGRGSGIIASDWEDFKDLSNIICGYFLYYDSNQLRKFWKIRKTGVHIISLYKVSPWIITGITMHCGSVRMGHIIKNHLLKHGKWKLYNLGVCFKKEKNKNKPKVMMKQMLNRLCGIFIYLFCKYLKFSTL